MSGHVNAISGRLSLRPPQRTSLEILARVMEVAAPRKGAEPMEVLEAVQREFPDVKAFARAFPSVCFALATGVGKTRLMGAFISYLHVAHGVTSFLVLAPNLTIYNKLIADFTPHSPKYVFRGIAEFAVRSPLIVTGDNFEDRPQLRLYQRDEVEINIFNISKINIRAKGTKTPRVKRLAEYLGQSYFGYLADQGDLVILMDEAHRYRASASMAAIDELRPVLGLELTATPQVESPKGPVPFRNVIYRYPLAQAMKDGFVKEPAVATRTDFNAAKLSPADLEQLKLEDGVRVHENTKAELATYAHNEGKVRVKPFMLVVARDTAHADQIVERIEDDQFFEGRYRGRVIQVHSGQSGAEKDDIVERLLAVERADEPTEIVVHVNMLKEGWDVTNLYTIVPLRAADSRTLVEQSIGRGLRLPYGKRTGVPAVDRLTIIAHDRFQDIVDEARRGGYTFSEITIGKDVPEKAQRVVVAKPTFTAAIGDESTETQDPVIESDVKVVVPRPRFDTPGERAAARATVEVIQSEGREILTGLGKSPAVGGLGAPAVQTDLVGRVRSRLEGLQFTLPGVEEIEDLAAVVREATEVWVDGTIAVPKIVVLPKGRSRAGFNRFDVDFGLYRPQPAADEILVQHLASEHREMLGALEGGHEEDRLEDYVVRGLIDFPDVSYDDQADVLYDLAAQVTTYLRTYLDSDDKVRNVLLFHQQPIVKMIHAQMKQHAWEDTTEHEVHVIAGFTEMRPQAFNVPEDARVRDFRTPVDNKRDIRSMIFGGFERCLYPQQKFDSDPERRFACILERDDTVRKWTKPGKGVFQIRYADDASYEPDFVVETATERLLCEPKQSDQLTNKTVRQKAAAAAKWCDRASEFESENGGKAWRYLLIPHDAITDNATLDGLAKAFTHTRSSSDDASGEG